MASTEKKKKKRKRSDKSELIDQPPGASVADEESISPEMSRCNGKELSRGFGTHEDSASSTSD
jgi:hypothetical protein